MKTKLLLGTVIVLTTLVLSAVGGKVILKLAGAKTSKLSIARDSEGRVDQLLNRYDQQALPELQAELSEDYNIILILTDDQNYRTWQHMPQLEREATERGVVFSNAFATEPTCCPFRASLMAGGFDAHETGVKALSLPNGSLYNLDENRTIATYLQAVGIKTGFVGKYMHGYHPGYVPPGWDSFVANEDGGMIHDYRKLYNITYGSSDASASRGEIRHSLFPKRQYITEFQTNEALSFIDDYKDERFFLFLSYYAPHEPHIVERPEDDEFAAGLDFSCDQDSSVSLKPKWVQIVAEIMVFNREQYGECGENIFYGQVALLQSIDRGFRQIVDKLESYDLTKKTVVLFTSDNGVVLGSKILYPDKGMPYEGSIRVPMIAFIPNVLASHHRELVAVNLDVGATILDLAGAPAPTEGQSLLDIVNQQPWRRERVLIENYGYLDWRRKRLGDPLPPILWSGFRTARWKYVEYTSGEVELYDLEADPAETQNLAENTDYSDIVEQFHDVLDDEKGLAITTSSLPAAVLDEAYEYQLDAWGGTQPYEWQVTSLLPDGLTLDAQSGVISGIPSSSGIYEVQLMVTDSGVAKHSLQPDHLSWKFELRVCEQGTEC